MYYVKHNKHDKTVQPHNMTWSLGLCAYNITRLHFNIAMLHTEQIKPVNRLSQVEFLTINGCRQQAWCLFVCIHYFTINRHKTYWQKIVNISGGGGWSCNPPPPLNTAVVVSTLNKRVNTKLSCRTEAARCFVSLNILLLKVIRNDTLETEYRASVDPC